MHHVWRRQRVRDEHDGAVRVCGAVRPIVGDGRDDGRHSRAALQRHRRAAPTALSLIRRRCRRLWPAAQGHPDAVPRGRRPLAPRPRGRRIGAPPLPCHRLHHDLLLLVLQPLAAAPQRVHPSPRRLPPDGTRRASRGACGQAGGGGGLHLHARPRRRLRLRSCDGRSRHCPRLRAARRGGVLPSGAGGAGRAVAAPRRHRLGVSPPAPRAIPRDETRAVCPRAAKVLGRGPLARPPPRRLALLALLLLREPRARPIRGRRAQRHTQCTTHTTHPPPVPAHC